LRGHRQTGFESPDELLRPLTSVHHCAQHPDHFEDLSDAPLIERMDGEPAAAQISDDVCLEIGEHQGQIRPKCEDLSMFAEVKALTCGFSRRL
jgi:hypothetical protein